ncbi:ExbD/TolR family protein [Candidatus Synechococcus spongiarum]|uniref:Biopolymer transport protein ExbD/TolR n=1 Tax=Candidatus Synechococcus spongiarum TaxID=431041 RepID=A0A171DEL3_9SYNE|nr:biopolymer transporter ExbD [Candidatus Synechococcus spongiarum]SAY38296.1 Biopolymer transport protein ExbD/TolR [Candidatus Synechococcus spongiarum]
MIMMFCPCRRSRVAVSLTPLIDVVFILLIFFMLVSNLQSTNMIDLRVGNRNATPTQAQDRALLVTVSRDALQLDGQPVPLAQLREQVALQPQRQVTLEPADGVSLQRIVAVLDQLRGAGASQVSFLAAASGE